MKSHLPLHPHTPMFVLVLQQGLRTLMHYRISWLVILSLVLWLGGTTLIQKTDGEFRRLVNWMSPTRPQSQVIYLGYPANLTDLQQKQRLAAALPHLLRATPRVVVLGGDRTHRSAKWVRRAQAQQSFDSSLSRHILALTKVITLALPLYDVAPQTAQQPGLVAPRPRIEIKAQRNAVVALLDPNRMPRSRSWVVLVDEELQEQSNLAAPLGSGGNLLFRAAANDASPEPANAAILSLPLALVPHQKPLLQTNQGILIAPRQMISADGRIWPRANPRHFRADSLALLDNQAPSLWQHHIVFIGANDDLALRASANTTAALLSGQWDWRPAWNTLALVGLLVLLTLYLLLLGPRLQLSSTWLVLALLLVLIGVAQVVSAITQHWWLSGSFAVLWLTAAQVLLWLGGSLTERLGRGRRLHDEAYQMLAVASQEKGELVAAFGYLKRCSGTTYTQDLLLQLGQNLERKREYEQTIGIYRYLQKLEPRKHRQLDTRIERLQQAASAVAVDLHLDGAKTLLLPNTDLHRPQLGRYQIEKVIGQGAMGVVYLGQDPKIGRSVAIKTLALSSEFAGADLDDAKERFYREAETAGRLGHPNIVTIYDVGEEQDLAYIAMDYLQGRPMNDFIKAETLLPVATVYDLMSQVAGALAYAHSQGIVHRDIKPANMIYDADNERVVVTDFGIACVTDNSKTRTGTILGSPYYMSPEQIAGSRVDGRADVFSLAVSFYQLLTGQLPFEGDNLAALTYSIANKKHTPLKRRNGNLPGSATRIINKALQKKREQRFQSANELADALRRAAEKLTL